jgi:hypothetical protein
MPHEKVVVNLRQAVLVGSFLWAAIPKPQPIFSKKPKKPKKNQSTKRPRNCPAGTKDIDKVKKDKGWDKDKLHGIKDATHDGMGKGDSWTGVAPDGTVDINEDGEWSPQVNIEDF